MQDGGDSLLCRDDFMRHDSRPRCTCLLECVAACRSDRSFLPFRQTTQPHSGSRASASEGVERSLLLRSVSVIIPRGPTSLPVVSSRPDESLTSDEKCFRYYAGPRVRLVSPSPSHLQWLTSPWLLKRRRRTPPIIKC